MSELEQNTPIILRILAALPQTQCGRCGFDDCAGYARAVGQGWADINRCAPGGTEGLERLAALTDRPVVPIADDCGQLGPRSVVFVDETWCIGCALCQKACPVDAIVGAAKWMHTVIEPLCTGCMRCVPVCPVDCIVAQNVSGAATGWQAWGQEQADQARHRYDLRSDRGRRDGLDGFETGTL